MGFAPGRVVRRREVLHGCVWLEHLVTVVADRDGVLAVLLEPGSPFTFPRHPFSQHPWADASAWRDTTVLQLHRDGDHYGNWKFFNADGSFRHWYVNLEASVVRHVDATGGGHYDTADHGIDIVVPADGSAWRWKDVDDPAEMAAAGRITPAEAEQIHRDAQGVAALLDAGTPWWAAWEAWFPGDSPPSTETGATRSGRPR